MSLPMPKHAALLARQTAQLTVALMTLSLCSTGLTQTDATSQATALSRAFRTAAAKVKPAVVTIIASRRNQRRLRDLLENPNLRDQLGFDLEDLRPSPDIGSGVIIGKQGLVLTNNHVIQNAAEVVVRLADGTEYAVKDTKTDRLSDLALLYIEPDADLPVADLGNSDQLEIGDWVIAIGSPFDLEATVSAGIISAKGRSIEQIPRAQLIQTDAAINPGNSGGPLVNLFGDVVGINTAIATSSGGYQGVGFAIPASKAKWILEQLQTEGVVRRAWLGIGIGVLNAEAARELNLRARSGIWVDRIYSDSPAAEAGVQRGDVIVEFGGRRVRSPGDLQAVVERMPVDSQQRMLVMRDGERLSLTVKIAALPNPEDGSESEAEEE